MAFLPDGRLLVSEVQRGLRIVSQSGTISAPLPGLPTPNGGLLGVIVHPQFATNHAVYVSFVEQDTGDTAGLAVALGTLTLDASGGGRLDDVKIIWRQTPKVVAPGEYGAHMAISPDGAYLFISAGDRNQFAPVQDMDNTLGKIVRLHADGSIPASNPFAGTAMPEIWTLGHRNPYGLAFDSVWRLWSHEMGPKGGDEFNLIEPGRNYGWPTVSNGSHYDDGEIPDHSPGDGFAAPLLSWTPVIAPAGMIIYSGNLFAAWRGDAIIGGLQSKGLVRVRFTGTSATEEQRIPLGARIRDVEEGPDGAIWVIEDAPTGRLLRLVPAS